MNRPARDAVRAALAIVLCTALGALAAPVANVAADTRAATPAAAPDAGTRVDGRPVPGTGPVTLRSGERLETGAAPARLRTSAGGELRVAPASFVRHQGVENGVESFYVLAGAVEGPITQSTIVGAAPGWARCDAGARAAVRVAIPTGTGVPADSAVVRALEGTVRVEYFAVAATLPAGSEVSLSPGGDGPGSLAFAAAASNRGVVEVLRRAGDATHAGLAAAGVSGVLSDRGAATRFACRTAPRGVLLALEVRSKAGPARTGSVGAGLSAFLEAGAIRFDVPALGPGAIERLRSVGPEFSTMGEP